MEDQTMMPFAGAKIRVAWDDEAEKWYFSVVDIIGVLTDSPNPTDYFKKMRKRDPELAGFVGTNCPQVLMTSETGRRRKTISGDMQTIFRVIQSIPAPKAEPIKQWIAKVASERVDETVDPELAVQRAVATYQRKGYDDAWIKERLQQIEERKSLTDEWKRVGVKEAQYAILTNDIYQAIADMSAKEYKAYKGLKGKENLRDNMTETENALTRIGEIATREISKNEDPKTFAHSRNIAARGGGVARAAREELEKQLGHSVISNDNAKTLQNPQKPKEIDDQ